MTDTTMADILSRVENEVGYTPTPLSAKRSKVAMPPAPAYAQEAIKHDSGKLPWFLLPSDAIDDVLEVLQYGAAKYGERNWERGMDWSRPFSALMRHMWSWWRGETYDPESGKPHLAHAACCVLFLLAYERRGVGVDSRVK